MFTGIVQALGRVEAVEPQPGGARLRLRTPAGWSPKAGESVAVNGCCLTVLADGGLSFDLSQETLGRSSLGALKAGDAVNLEPALRSGDALGGHLMAGHVDGLAELVQVRPQGGGAEWDLRADASLMRFVAEKASVALDGVSLTPFHVSDSGFTVALIPHTLQATQFHARRPGDRLNLEIDLVARYVQRLLESRAC